MCVGVITILQNESWRKRREGDLENKMFGLLPRRDPFEFASISVSSFPLFSTGFESEEIAICAQICRK